MVAMILDDDLNGIGVTGMPNNLKFLSPRSEGWLSRRLWGRDADVHLSIEVQ